MPGSKRPLSLLWEIFHPPRNAGSSPEGRCETRGGARAGGIRGCYGALPEGLKPGSFEEDLQPFFDKILEPTKLDDKAPFHVQGVG